MSTESGESNVIQIHYWKLRLTTPLKAFRTVLAQNETIGMKTPAVGREETTRWQPAEEETDQR